MLSAFVIISLCMVMDGFGGDWVLFGECFGQQCKCMVACHVWSRLSGHSIALHRGWVTFSTEVCCDWCVRLGESVWCVAKIYVEVNCLHV